MVGHGSARLLVLFIQLSAFKTCTAGSIVTLFGSLALPSRERVRRAVVQPLSRIGRGFLAYQKKKKLARSEGERFWGPIEPAMKRYEKLIPIQQFF